MTRFLLLALLLQPFVARAACPSASKFLGTYQAEETQFTPDQNVTINLITFTLQTVARGVVTYVAGAESGLDGSPVEENFEPGTLTYTYDSKACRGSIVAPGGNTYRFTVDGAGTIRGIFANEVGGGIKVRLFRAYRQ